jgi:hypothetical protein
MHNTDALCRVEIQLYWLTSALHIVSFTAWSLCTRGNGAKDGLNTLSHNIACLKGLSFDIVDYFNK